MVRASLFVTCLIDQFYPEVGESVVNVLRRLGVDVDFPAGQTCCGQPAFNTGYLSEARPLAERYLELFEHSDYVVVPSGSCGAMLKEYVPHLVRDDAALHRRARSLARRTYEFSQFLVNVLRVRDVGARFEGTVTYHASCHLLRELRARSEAETLIRNLRGAGFVEMESATDCCGFGGTFSVKYPEISGGILESKLQAIENTGAGAVVACDSGCLMHIGGALSRRRMKTRALHIAQVLDQTG